MIDTILFIISAICFGLATVNVAERVNLVALGLLAFVLTFLLPL